MRYQHVDDWLDWQARLHPADIELGLDRVRQVWERMQCDLDAAIITVAGTNGKGSTVAFVASILQSASYRVGVYTSPHLQHYNERIQVDGRPVDDDQLCAAFDQVDRARGDVALTYFEFGTLAALGIFASAGLDAVVLEVGLGGRLDAVNIIDSDVALITGIALDHQDWLGNDREQIGREKAGIMRRGRPVVFSGRDIPDSVRDHAASCGAQLLVANEDFRVIRHDDAWDVVGESVLDRLALPWPAARGAHQVENAAGALVALALINSRLPIDQRAARAGLLSARVAGRFDVRPGQPVWVLDVAHNPDAASTLQRSLANLFCRGQRIAVFGMLEDKAVADTVAALGDRIDRWEVAGLDDLPRGLSSAMLCARAGNAFGDRPVHQHPDAASAFEAVAQLAGADDVVVVFGSFLLVGAAIGWLDKRDSAA